MKLILGARASGKTTKLLDWAVEAPDRMILDASKHAPSWRTVLHKGRHDIKISGMHDYLRRRHRIIGFQLAIDNLDITAGIDPFFLHGPSEIVIATINTDDDVEQLLQIVRTF